MSKNYYDELIERINEHIKTNNNKEAILLIEEELRLPYIPIDYEKKILKIYQDINNELGIKKNKNHVFSKDEIIDIFLKFNNEHSNDFLLEISQLMLSYSWNNYLSEIQNIFNLTTIKKNVKASIYNVLSIQNINHVFQIEKIELNPYKNLTTFETTFASKNFELLSNENFDDYTVIDVSKKILMLYVLNLFPQSMNFKFKDITNDLIMVAQFMLGKIQEKELSSLQKSIYKTIKH